MSLMNGRTHSQSLLMNEPKTNVCASIAATMAYAKPINGTECSNGWQASPPSGATKPHQAQADTHGTLNAQQPWIELNSKHDGNSSEDSPKIKVENIIRLIPRIRCECRSVCIQNKTQAKWSVWAVHVELNTVVARLGCSWIPICSGICWVNCDLWYFTAINTTSHKSTTSSGCIYDGFVSVNRTYFCCFVSALFLVKLE